MGTYHNCSNFGGSDGCARCMDDLKVENAALSAKLEEAKTLDGIRKATIVNWMGRCEAAELQVRELRACLENIIVESATVKYAVDLAREGLAKVTEKRNDDPHPEATRDSKVAGI